jgi:hypothetical protein
LGLVCGVGPHVGLGREAAESERDHPDGGQLGVLIEDPSHGVLQDRPVVHARADHHLAVHLDAGVEEHPEPAQAGRPPRVAQHRRADRRVGGVDGHEQRAQALRDDPFGVELGEPGQRGEVPVEEGQAVVVVLQIQAPPHALGELVDEAEGAVVVAGADPVEHRRRNLEAQWLAGRLLHPDPAVELGARPSDHHVEARRVHHLLVLDDIAGLLAVERNQLVTDLEPGRSRW